MKINLSVLLALICCLVIGCESNQQPKYPLRVRSIEANLAKEMSQKIRQEVGVELADGLELSLWASDSLIHDPIAISIDPNGQIFYTSASRQTNSEFDIRGHRNWMTASISFETVEDRRAFLRETFTPDSDESIRHLKDLNADGVRDWRDLAVQKEQVWFVSDASGDGIADRAQLYLEDFGEEITDVANGITYHDGEVFIGAGPDLWRSKDTDGDGIADEATSISHGFAVHIGFSGHGMSGVTVGPTGRIWWGIGDIGMNVIDKEGKAWKYPNQGVVVRSEPDGSNFEVYAAGVRNTHEFVFDNYGNLITEDNDGDHRGERERLVYLINGSDSGWRTNWQFGKYTDPKNNDYKVWMRERLHVPHWEGQAAYILPPIQNYVNGPTGMVYNPGTALGEEWYDHFFISEFRGTPASSPIHAFQLKPKGASFEMTKTQEVVRGLLPTGLDFGPDGALYFGDWIDGWATKAEGRIWKLDIPGGADAAIRQETKGLIEEDFTKRSPEELQTLLSHQDRRIRQKAQFQLAKAGKESLKIFETTAQANPNQLARIHALWGMNQLARKWPALAENFLPFLGDSDPEIIAQAIKMLGDLRYAAAASAIVPFVNDDNPRIRLLATEALGRMEAAIAFEDIVQMLRQNNDTDFWLRHAGMIALARIGDAQKLGALAQDNSAAVRIASVVALRRMKDPGVAKFLADSDEHIVMEAARAINDDYNIPDALPALAEYLLNPTFQNEVIIRRAINANVEVGSAKHWQQLLAYSQNVGAPAEMRAEALAALSNWGSPSVFDRVDGRYRGTIAQDSSIDRAALQALLVECLADPAESIKIAAMRAAAQQQERSLAPSIYSIFRGSQVLSLKTWALQSLKDLEFAELNEALQMALEDPAKEVRSKALELLPAVNLPIEQTLPLFASIFEEGSLEEQQATLKALESYQSPGVVAFLNNLLKTLLEGNIAPAIQLDLLESAAAQKQPELDELLAQYETQKPVDDILAKYQEALIGGNAQRGRNIFYNNEAAQCVRCHAIFEVGGNAGPGLLGVGARLDREALLQSLVAPSAAFSAGYEVVILELEGAETRSGIVLQEDETSLTLKIGKEDIQRIEKNKIIKREQIPSSMPVMGDVLDKRQIRDLVAFLVSLQETEG